MFLELPGRVAVVTGAARGIGFAIAERLSRAGARVVIADVAEDGAAAAVERLRERGGKAEAAVADVTRPEEVAATFERAVDAFGKLDILVNNAGILRDKMIVSMSEEDFDAVIRVHLKGTFVCTHHAANYWREQSKAGSQPRAAIVNTVSSAGLQGNVGQVNYGSAKAAIAAMTQISSLELARYGVRANAIAPGGFTRMVGVAMKDVEVKEADEYTDDEFVPMNPANSAPMVAWLASDEALHVTGQVFRAVGHTITHYLPWTWGPTVEGGKPGEPARWDATRIGEAVNAHIFRSRAPGMSMG